MSERGRIILVGAGPGRLGLLTIRGKEAIESADVVLFDRLVGSEILSLIPDDAVKVDVGKSAGRHPVPQHEINELLLKFARDGKIVVRLKGGDPYLFGRGAEELEGIIKEDIQFEVVPGITSAIAVPAFAGIPVSHRDFSSSVHIITAHRKNNSAPDIDYSSLVKFGGTLIFLMGLETLDLVSSGLIGAGMPASTPAALIENGTRPNQRRLVSTVGEIAAESKRKAFKSPSIFIIGEVCSLAEKFDWFMQLPLFGVNVIVTRPEGENNLSRRLRALGANVTDFPCIRTVRNTLPDDVFLSLSKYAWIVLTSPSGAKMFFSTLKERDIDIRSLHGIKFAAVGSKTAGIIAEKGIKVDYVPDVYNARELAKGIPFAQGGENSALLFRAQDGTAELSEILVSRGFSVADIAAYSTIRESDASEELKDIIERGDAGFVMFTSKSTVEGFTAALEGADFTKTRAICIGEETAAEARKRGFIVYVSETATIESMIERLIEERS